MLVRAGEEKLLNDLLGELRRRNVFRVGVAYIVVAWLIAQVAELALDSFDAPSWVIKTILLLLALGLPVALFFAWAFELTPEGLKKEKEVDRSQSITHQTGRKLDSAIIGILVIAVALNRITRWFSSKVFVELTRFMVVTHDYPLASDEALLLDPRTLLPGDEDDDYRDLSGLDDDARVVRAVCRALDRGARVRARWRRERFAAGRGPRIRP